MNKRSKYFVNPNRILKYLQILRKNNKIPISVEMHPTMSCNFKCKHCLFSEKLKPISMESCKIQNIISELHSLGTRSIIFSGGEPLLHNKIDDILSFTHNIGIKYGIFTNGSKMNNINSLFKAEWIRISLDSATKSMFHKIKGIKKYEFEKIINNIKNLIDNRKKRPIIILSLVAQRSNYREIELFHKLTYKLNADCVQVRPKMNDKFLLFNYKKKPFQKIVDESQKIDIPSDIAELPERIEEMYMTKSCKICRISNLISLISGNGNVYPCCRVAYNKDYIMGNIYKNTFNDIWNSYKYSQFRNSPCKFTCRYSEMNNILEKNINLIKSIKVTENVFSSFI